MNNTYKAFSIQRESSDGIFFRRDSGAWTKKEDKAGRWGHGKAMDLRIFDRNTRKIADSINIYENHVPADGMIWVGITQPGQDGKPSYATFHGESTKLEDAAIFVSKSEVEDFLEEIEDDRSYFPREVPLASYFSALSSATTDPPQTDPIGHLDAL